MVNDAFVEMHDVWRKSAIVEGIISRSSLKRCSAYFDDYDLSEQEKAECMISSSGYKSASKRLQDLLEMYRGTLDD